MIGLGLVALSIYLAFVFYFGWDGGKLGEALRDGLVLGFGDVAYASPIALGLAGALCMFGDLVPSVRPIRAGGLCLIAAALLGLAAGSFGLGPGRPAGAEGFLEADLLRDRGGAVGEALYWTISTLFQEIGAHIVFCLLLVIGLLLITGATVAGIVEATQRRVSTARARVRSSSEELASLFRRTPTVAGDTPYPYTDEEGVYDPQEQAAPEVEPPEVEPVVRGTHVEAPALDGAERYPDFYADDTAEVVDEALPAVAEPEPEPEPEPAGKPSAIDLPRAEEDELTPQGNRRSEVTEADDLVYRPPSSKLLVRGGARAKVDVKGQEKVGATLVEALGHFGIESSIVGTIAGPHVTRYELRLAPGTKMTKVAQLKDDIAYALAATDVRILAPVPGKQAVGVEVPNAVKRMVHLGDVYQAAPEGWSPLTVWLGKDIGGKAIGTDLAKQPHLLVAGTTGSGKSQSLNTMLSSILLRATPNEVRLVLVDPKRVELNHYEGIPHLLTPVVTSPRAAANVLGNLTSEMEARYSLMEQYKTRDLVALNARRAADGERTLPYILCVIEELGDLMMVSPAEVEDAIIRLAQKSRAVGIHLVLATQRPSVDVITGLIKANVPARIAFVVSSQTDSRVILDQNGAESLLGKGDMLFRPSDKPRPARLQGALISEEEILTLTDHWRGQGEPELREDMLEALEAPAEEGPRDEFDPDADDLLPDAIATVVQMGSASTSMLQRRLRVGYTRAGRLIDMMERRGVISGYEGSKARQVLISEADLPRVLAALSEPVGGQAVPAGVEDER